MMTGELSVLALLLPLLGFYFAVHNEALGVEGGRLPPTARPKVISGDIGGSASKGVVKSVYYPGSAVPYITNSHSTSLIGDYVHHYAMYRSPYSEYYGATAKFSVHELPDVETLHASSVQIWVLNADVGEWAHDTNVLQAGWHVRPDLYGDTKTRFYTYWTADSYNRTGCTDLACPGFVVDSGSPLVPGSILSPVSKYNGEQRYITLTIIKDEETGNWELIYGELGNSTRVGYWPNSLFTRLRDYANLIDFGGTSIYQKDSKGPPLGSGHYSTEGEGKAASFKNLQFINNDRNFVDLNPEDQVIIVDAKECYGLDGVPDYGASNGLHFYYGGPGGCTNTS